jgi:hypothetical protein
MAKHTCKGHECKTVFPRGTNRNTRYCVQCRHTRDLELKRKTWHRHKDNYRKVYA